MIRSFFVLLAFAILTLVLLPFQLIGIAFKLPLQRGVPYVYHRILCGLIGIRVHEIGKRSPESPLLILANHASWLDILVITSLTPAVFVAKKEVAGWPVFGWLAKLQRTVFIDRERRHRTGAATQEIADRLNGGDAVVLFAEGTSSDGNRILPFRSALIGAVHHVIARLRQPQRPAARARVPQPRRVVRRRRSRSASDRRVLGGRSRRRRQLGRADLL
jgi:1-acyl-sn-glycerol-3-phosphate acyltransferase